MHHVNRGDLRFVAFKGLVGHGSDRGTNLRDPRTLERVLSKMKAAAESVLQNDAFMYGQWAEAMFGSMVLSLGNAVFIKQEDQGDCYSSRTPLEIPDFRIVLRSGDRTLVEVKNHYQPSGDEPFEVKREYVDGLANYSELADVPVRLAIYWPRWRLWTLTGLHVIRWEGDRGILPITEAIMHNETALLGDREIATEPPLAIRLRTAEVGRQAARQGQQNVTLRIEDVELLSANRQIHDDTEKRIALHLMLFGNWQGDRIPRTRDGHVVSIDYEYRPVEKSDEPMVCVGSLSTMFSAFYRSVTADSEQGVPQRIAADVKPNEFAQLIPDNYSGKALPIWQLILKPR